MLVIFQTLSVIFLLYVTYEDVRTKFIDDKVMLFGVIMLFPLSCYVNGWKFALYGAIAGFLLPAVVYILSMLLSKITGKRSIGAGDITVSILIGVLVGWYNFIFLFYFAFCIHVVIGFPVCIYKKDFRAEVPFMPAYFIAFIINMTFLV